jgi:hypothetical protein
MQATSRIMAKSRAKLWSHSLRKTWKRSRTWSRRVVQICQRQQYRSHNIVGLHAKLFVWKTITCSSPIDLGLCGHAPHGLRISPPGLESFEIDQVVAQLVRTEGLLAAAWAFGPDAARPVHGRVGNEKVKRVPDRARMMSPVLTSPVSWRQQRLSSRRCVGLDGYNYQPTRLGPMLQSSPLASLASVGHNQLVDREIGNLHQIKIPKNAELQRRMVG